MKETGIKLFEVLSFGVTVSGDLKNGVETEAKVKVIVNDEVKYTVANGNGPISALDKALRKALLPFYPLLANIQLVDYRVSILNKKEGTASLVSVVIVSSDGNTNWIDQSESTNVIQASLQALANSFEKVLSEKSTQVI